MKTTVLLSALVAGTIGGLLLKGDLRRLSALHLRWLPLLVGAALVRALAPYAPFAPIPLYVAALAGMVAVALANRVLPGALLIGLGTSLNLLVIVANEGMPVDLGAAATVGSAGPHSPLHLVLGPQTRPLRRAPFARVWLASVVNGFGDEISLIALAYVSWQLTSSALFTSLAIVITTVPNALFGIFAGAVADALGHRRAMISSDLVRCVLVGAIAPLLAVGAPLALAYALVFVSATLASISRPARLSLVPDLLPPGGLGAGNSLMSSSDRVVKIVGALVAGGVVALLGQGAFYVDAITFGLSALLLAGIAGPLAPRRSRQLFVTAVSGHRAACGRPQ